MYLLDDRFSSAVSFVEGYNLALNGAPLSGFQEYVSMRIVGRKSSVHWSYVIASQKVSSIIEKNLGIEDIPNELGAELTNTLVDLLEEYQAVRLQS